MLNNAKNKMLNARDRYIMDCAKNKDMTPAEIEVTLKGQGFEKITRPRIHQIIQGNK
jgi:hypothetical protein